MSDADTQVHDILDQVEDAEREGRPGNLTELCGDDAELQKRVREYQQQVNAGGAVLRAAREIPNPVPEDPRRIPSNRRYIKLDKCAAGGFGRVWKGFDTQLKRYVAIKESKSADLDSHLYEEARRAANLSHPNIVGVYDVYRRKGRLYVVSEWIEGGSLTEHIGKIEWRQACQIVRELADALAHAHAKGITHCDIKPDNILLTAEGHPMLSDFGISLTRREIEQGAGHGVGTPQYMSPEQAHNSGIQISEASDVYALGKVLGRLLEGQPVEKWGWENTLESLKRLPKRLSVPRALHLLANRAQDPDPSKRPGNAAALRDELMEVETLNPASNVQKKVLIRKAVIATTKIASLALIGHLGVKLPWGSKTTI